MSPSTRRDVLGIVLVALAYFLASQIAFLFPDANTALMVIWPAAGIGLSSLLLSPRRLWPAMLGALYAAGSLADILQGRPLAASLGFKHVPLYRNRGRL